MLQFRPSNRNGESYPPSLSHFVEQLHAVDDLIGTVEQMMVASHSHSPFNDYMTQLSDSQSKVVREGIGELRTAMLCLVRRVGATIDSPHVNTTWAIRRTLTLLDEKLTQLNPLLCTSDGLRQSGTREDQENLMAQMRSVVKRLHSTLE